MFPKIFVLCWFTIAVTDSAPLEGNKSPEVTRYEYEHLPDNAYHFVFELSDGQKRDEHGSFKKVGDQLILVVEGSYSFIGDDGKEYEVQYIADENGFKASGDHLPGMKPEHVVVPGSAPSFVAQISPSLVATLAG